VLRSQITEWENRLRIDYLLREADSGQRLTKAWTIQVAVDAASGELQFVCPPVLRQRLGIDD
jgi:acyl-CoA thioester hydrolase